jgi:hypothetical protein
MVMPGRRHSTLRKNIPTAKEDLAVGTAERDSVETA